MKKLSKKLLSVLLIIAMLVPTRAMTVSTSAVEDNAVGIPGYVQNTSGEKAKGTCTDTISWTLYNDGELVIVGTGKMPDWSYHQLTPWYPYHTFTRKVTIGNGITHIGVGAFENTENLEIAIIPKSVVSKDGFAFWYCYNLKTVFYTGTEEEWNKIKTIGFEDKELNAAEKVFEWNPLLGEDYYIAGSKFNKQMDYFSSYCNSSVYNPELANMTAALSAAVYDKDAIENAYLSLGFDKDQFDFYDYDGEFNPYKSGHTIGLRKSQYNDDYICLVAVRGTVGSLIGSDWIGNFSIATTSDDKHVGFAYPANYIYSDIKNLLEEKNISGNVKYVVTGHSRGAAVANLLSVQLMENGVSSSNVYNYNFACPDVACKDSFTNYSNIFNLCNREDPVPFIPGPIASVMTTSGTSWGKFGQTYWFTKDAEGTIDPVADHDMDLYLDFFDQQKDPSKWSNSFLDIFDDVVYWTQGWVSKILCPVDVIVKDTDGNKIASVIDGEVNYYDSNFGDVIILTDGDKKVIFVSGDRDFNIELVGTDDGAMTYSVEKCNLMTEEIFESKTFENVKLENDKKMYSPVSNAETTEDIELFVIEKENGEDVTTHAINTDGTETEIYHIYETVIVNPTCTEKGYTAYTCSNCGDSYKDLYIDATGHSDSNHDGICDACSEDFTKGCSCNCHGNAFMQFLHKIVTFLRKLFGMKQYQYCNCGKAHW